MTPFVDILQALLTPLVALVTTYIAYQQYRIRRDERSMQLYDRRLAVFNRVIAVIDKIFAGNKIDTQEALSWVASVREANFLFGREVETVIDHVFSRVHDYAAACESVNDYNTECAGAANEVEDMRSLVVDSFSAYLRPAGSLAPRKKRLSIAEIEKRIESSQPTVVSRDNDDIPF